MLEEIQNFHKQFLVGWDIASKVSTSFGKIDAKKVSLVGMGGSALPADLLNDVFQGNLHINIIRDYAFSGDLTDGSLVFCASYSGNTEETIEQLYYLLEQKANVIVLSHGGKLREIAQKNGLPFVVIPDCVQPRQASGYFFSAMLFFLHTYHLTDISRKNLEILSSALERRQDRCEEVGRNLAVDLNGKVPMIYGPSELGGVCRIFKIKINENAKVSSFYNVFPEINHNEMVGFTNTLLPFSIVYLKTKSMHPKIARRMDVMESVLSDRMPFHSVNLSCDSHLDAVFEGCLIGDYTSYYLAVNAGLDPAPVQLIESFKKKL